MEFVYIALFGGACVLALALWASVVEHCLAFRMTGKEEANGFLLFALAVLMSVAVLKMAPEVWAANSVVAARAAESGGFNWFPVALAIYPVALVCAIAKFAPKTGLAKNP